MTEFEKYSAAGPAAATRAGWGGFKIPPETRPRDSNSQTNNSYSGHLWSSLVIFGHRARSAAASRQGGSSRAACFKFIHPFEGGDNALPCPDAPVEIVSKSEPSEGRVTRVPDFYSFLKDFGPSGVLRQTQQLCPAIVGGSVRLLPLHRKLQKYTLQNSISGLN
jgi:hypothetical protein